MNLKDRPDTLSQAAHRPATGTGLKTLGLIGGMSWESTVPYYQHINQAVAARLGGLHSAKLLLASLDFAEIAALQAAGDWGTAAAQLAQAARHLQAAGAQALVICTNTMHCVAPAVQAAIDIPLLHIADATAQAARAAGHATVGLLGTRFTMSQPFYRERLQQHGLRVLTPDAATQNALHRIIFEELCRGQFLDASRQTYLDTIADLHAQGAQAVILGCTEIGLLVQAQHTPTPLLDTTVLHAQAAAAWALGDAPMQNSAP
ncbi:MAG: aspartate/glutamate racemase family protein [Rhodoferax sp.]